MYGKLVQITTLGAHTRVVTWVEFEDRVAFEEAFYANCLGCRMRRSPRTIPMCMVGNGVVASVARCIGRRNACYAVLADIALIRRTRATFSVIANFI